MKSGEQAKLGISSIEASLEARLIEHIGRHRLTTRLIWPNVVSLRDTPTSEIVKALRSLSKRGIVRAFPLHHGRFYFTLTKPAAAKLIDSELVGGQLSDGGKLKAFARLLLATKHTPIQTPISKTKLLELWGSIANGLPDGFYTRDGKPTVYGFLRIDACISSSASRASQQLRNDIFRFVKIRPIVELIKEKRFELSLVAATQFRAEAIMQRFRAYERVGATPVNMIVLPELLPLLTSVPIGAEEEGNTVKTNKS